MFAPGHLGELTQLIPFEMVDEVLAVTRRTQQRIRLLPARVVVYLLLAGCLFPEVGYPLVWRKLTAGLAALGVPEIWHYNGEQAQVYNLVGDAYVESPTSRFFAACSA